MAVTEKQNEGKQDANPHGMRSFIRWFTLERVAAISAIIAAFAGIGFQYYQIRDLKLSQQESDKKQDLLSSNVARIGSVLEAVQKAELSPYPYVDGPLDPIGIKPNQSIFNAGELALRNIGKGNCYDFSLAIRFDELVFCDETGKVTDRQEIEVQPVSVMDSITLPAGQHKPFKNFAYPLSESTDPQALNGVLMMRCRDGSGHPHLFVQPFQVLVHMEPKNPHAHLWFNATQELKPPHYMAVLPNGRAMYSSESPHWKSDHKSKDIRQLPTLEEFIGPEHIKTIELPKEAGQVNAPR